MDCLVLTKVVAGRGLDFRFPELGNLDIFSQEITFRFASQVSMGSFLVLLLKLSEQELPRDCQLLVNIADGKERTSVPLIV